MLERLEQLVRTTGDRIRALKDTSALHGDWDGPQLKTEADLIAHSCFVEGLGAIDSGLPVVSEENLASQTARRPERYFLIDPIDGTASLAGGFSGWVCQVALMERGRPTLAAVCAPDLGQVYAAKLGAGARLNGRMLRLDRNPSHCILIDNYPEPRGSAIEIMAHLNCTGYLECGGISLKILRVADGTADVFFKDVVVRDWDLAAPQLVLEEAGAVLSLINGAPMVYEGSFDKPGVVATHRSDMSEAVVQWWKGRGAEA